MNKEEKILTMERKLLVIKDKFDEFRNFCLRIIELSVSLLEEHDQLENAAEIEVHLISKLAKDALNLSDEVERAPVSFSGTHVDLGNVNVELIYKSKKVVVLSEQGAQEINTFSEWLEFHRKIHIPKESAWKRANWFPDDVGWEKNEEPLTGSSRVEHNR